MATDVPTASQPRSANDLEQWQSRIRQIQSSKVTPEVLERLMQAGEKQKRARTQCKKVEQFQRINKITTASTTRALQAFQNSASALDDATREVAAQANARSSRLQQVMTNAIFSAGSWLAAPAASAAPANARRRGEAAAGAASCPSLSAPPQEHDEEEEAAMDDALAEMEAEVGIVPVACSVAPRVAAAEAAADRAAAAEFASLLGQLAKEPTNAEELAVKFSLFERFLDDVTAVRDKTRQFWLESLEHFDGGARVAGQKAVDRIDRADAMAVEDDASKWFVYTMTQKAADNSSAINKVLSMLKARLALLSQELGDCPFCLDALTPGHVTSLGCCHRVCTDCWDHWVTLKGAPGAFCPLCKHTEFVQDIVSTTASTYATR